MKKREEMFNGNMTNSFEDMVWLGKQMDRLRDEEQLEEDGRMADPEQYS
ncbi:hypothetical protein [Mangrovibacillus cuniculi]|uniref:Multidrug ABC transporter ATPase n=1 Tax=Mangrovibacillus cuniculi TaxID=2593652 RepID=A0A7S8C9N9_9BACI|nr:hypothetical protein [Mangrovibacillus cuniculi]QPC45821.1 multidrug ABC transporter ATPase [Mangrovibacillus cuniculi]